MSYQPPILLFNRHLETIYPAVARRVSGIQYMRERLTTPDDDFLDLDWIKNQSNRLVILSHGLEGNSQRAYIKGMARIFSQNGFDILAWNYRGCSEDMNRQLRFYHSGATDDLALVIAHALKQNYSEIFLVGFSLGGNLTLKYLGEKKDQLPAAVKKGVAISVPLNLHTSCLKISEPANWIYTQRFLRSLKKKVMAKHRQWPALDVKPLRFIGSLIEFDNHYTAPVHGFKDAIDYYEQCSSIRFVESVQRPVLIINAQNDPFLSKDCFPDHFSDHPFIQTEYPQRGGHVGFALFNQNGLYWSELRALQFIQSHD
jgi:uncharacterized protein